MMNATQMFEADSTGREVDMILARLEGRCNNLIQALILARESREIRETRTRASQEGAAASGCAASKPSLALSRMLALSHGMRMPVFPKD